MVANLLAGQLQCHFAQILAPIFEGLNHLRLLSRLGSTVPRKKSSNRTNEQIETWDLRLYIAGRTARAVTAFENLKKICEEHLDCQYRIEVIDLLANPQLARGDQILAVPTLVRKLPVPVRKIIGDLSDVERVLVGLDLRPRK